MNYGDKLTIYPNPNNGNFIIVSKEKLSLILINNLGQLVQEIELNEGNYFQQKINLSSSGIYYISGFNDKTSVKQKIIVTK
jgi:hypothetical protein